MSEVKWTDEQQSAIETRNCNLLVAAAAGSGKTAVLVERIIRMITDKEKPVDIDKLLVVTFTNAAASEMRGKIAAAITKELEKNPTSKNLQKQLSLLNKANITTMHSFCLNVIKSNFHIIDLDPMFRILDDTEGILLQSEVLEELFERKYEEEDNEFLELVEAYSSSKNDEKLKEIVLNLYKFAMSGPEPEEWLRAKSEELNITDIKDIDNSIWMEQIKEYVQLRIEGVRNIAYKIKDYCEEQLWLQPYMESLSDDLVIIDYISNSLNKGIENFYKTISNIKFSRLKTIGKNNVEIPELQDRVKALRELIKKDITSISKEFEIVEPELIKESMQQIYSKMKKLSEIVIEFKNDFERAKRDKGALDFNDLEHLCLKILKAKEGAIADSYKELFEEVLVDEYQDSNSIQETIIDLVSKKNTDEPNVFMVGDVKQSIYKFRKAKPELFLDKYNNYSKVEGSNRLIQLFKNFRSREEIINGVNFVFKVIMSKEVGELDYTEEEKLNLGADYKLLEEDGTVGGNIEVNIIDKASSNIEDNNEEEAEEQEDLSSMNLEAKIVAKRIKELLESDYKVWDGNLNKYRKPSYKDIVILFRATKDWSEVFVEEMGKEGIPVYADTGSGYFEAIEVRTIISLLQVIDNPMQDIPLISLLRSPIINFTAEELSDIRLVNKDKYFYENIMMIAEEGKTPLADKCKQFLTQLEEWRDKATYMQIDELIWYLYTDSGYYGYVGAMPNGILRQANLKILFQRAKQYEETSFKGLFNFITFINRLKKSSGDMGSAKILGENEDVVRIMSIHKSKGLEFPIVFLAGTGKQFNMQDLKKNILYHDDLGYGPDYVDIEKRVKYTTLPKLALKNKMKLEILSEEIRILYVAFTRAKEKLIITGSISGLEKKVKEWSSICEYSSEKILPLSMFKLKSYIDWIAIAMMKHPDGEILREKADNLLLPTISDLSTWEIKLWNKDDISVDNNQEDVDKKTENPLWIINEEELDVDNEIYDRLNYVYKYKDITTLKSNVSVSDLKKKNYESEEEVHNIYTSKIEEKKPRFIQEKKGLTPAEKGTAMHFVMQKLDFEAANSIEQIKVQIKDMLDRDLISQMEYDSINVYKVFRFIQSDLGKRAVQNKDNLYKEFPFYTEISPLNINSNLSEEFNDEKVRLQGVIDAYFYEGNEIVLYDYKTDYVEEGNEEIIINRYKLQLRYYRDALEKVTGSKVKECYLYLFSLNKEVKVEL